jgi:2-haloacid dehalogenase
MQIPLPIVVFDLGGVLIDWNPRYLFRKFFRGDHVAMERFLEEIGFHEWNSAMDRGRSFAESVDSLCRRFPHRAPLIRIFHDRWEETLGEPIQPVVSLLRRLKQAGIELHALTNWSADTFPIARRRFSFLECFSTILVSGEVGLVKPDPRIFSLFLERIGQTAADCIYIDDTIQNVQYARSIGMDAIFLSTPSSLEEELARRGLPPAG